MRLDHVCSPGLNSTKLKKSSSPAPPTSLLSRAFSHARVDSGTVQDHRFERHWAVPYTPRSKRTQRGAPRRGPLGRLQRSPRGDFPESARFLRFRAPEARLQLHEATDLDIGPWPTLPGVSADRMARLARGAGGRLRCPPSRGFRVFAKCARRTAGLANSTPEASQSSIVGPSTHTDQPGQLRN